MTLIPKIRLVALALIFTGCSTFGPSGDGKGYFKSSAETVSNEKALGLQVQAPDDSNVDGVYMQSKADYHFTLAESYSLQDKPQLSVENYKLALVYDQKSPQIRYRLSLEYVKLGLVSEAISEAKKAIELDPNHKPVSLLLGGLYSALHLYDQAMAQYNRVLKNEPSDLEANLFVGALYAEQGQHEKGAQFLLKLVDRKDIKEKSQIWYYLGRIYSTQEKPQLANAQSAFVTALKLKPEYLEAVVALGGLYEAQDKVPQATKTYENYQKEFGAHPMIAERLSQIYLAENDIEKAHEQLVIVEANNPRDTDVSLKIALLMVEQKKYTQAISRMEKIAKNNPRSEKVRFYLGALYEEVKNYRAAVQQFQSIPYGSEYFEDSILHGSYLFKILGDASAAKKEVRRGLTHDDDNPKYWVLLASLFDEEKNLDEAVEVLEKAVKKFPDHVQVNFQLGSVYDRLGRKDKTVQHLEKVISVDENHVQGLNYLAYVYAENTLNLKAAEKLVRKALLLQPNDGFIMDTLGWVLFKQDRVKEAVVVLEKAFQKEKGESIIAEHLGDVYYRYKLHNKARDMYVKAASLEKDSSNRKKINAKIKTIKNKLALESQKAPRGPSSKNK